ncbi:MAG: prk [Gemmatimonadetes bacterium]|nr:prk [Gemmatimonadota bacterium]
MSDAPDNGSPTHYPFILGIIGDSGSGKSTIADGVRTLIGADRVTSLELDDYHRYTRAERLDLGLTALSPTVHNLPLMQEHLQLLRRGRPVRNRRYDHTDGSFGAIRTLEPNEVVIARGLLGFPTEELRAAYDLAVFLQPEPELLFRWKLRRDVKTRGYSEAEVLKRIAQHLLDSKQYVLPQADRADLVVRSDIPEWDAPDSAVTASLLLRRAAAEAVRNDGVLPRFAGQVHLEEGEAADEVTLRIEPTLTADSVEDWARELFPDTYAPGLLGAYMDEDGATQPSGPIGFAQVLIADLTQKLRRTADTTRGAVSEGARLAV